MVALADFSELRSATAVPSGMATYLKTGLNPMSTLASAFLSPWTIAGSQAGAVPSASVVCDSSTVGAHRGDTNTTDRIITSVTSRWNDSTAVYGYGNCIIIDRLVHSGSLSGIVTTAQTTNLPTAALTRYTSGVGVFAAIEVYTALGATDLASISVSYTNQAGTAARTGTIYPDTSTPGIGAFYPMMLQSGDTGVRSVESVTLSASTGTAGDFGVTLFKPLAMIGGKQLNTRVQAGSFMGWNSGIHADACLGILMGASNTTQIISLTINTYSG